MGSWSGGGGRGRGGKRIRIFRHGWFIIDNGQLKVLRSPIRILLHLGLPGLRRPGRLSPLQGQASQETQPPSPPPVPLCPPLKDNHRPGDQLVPCEVLKSAQTWIPASADHPRAQLVDEMGEGNVEDRALLQTAFRDDEDQRLRAGAGGD